MDQMEDIDNIIERNSTSDGLCIIPQDAKSGLRNALSKAARKGEMQRLAPRVYVRTDADHDAAVEHNIFSIVASLYPGAVISHRSALESGLDPSNKHIIITHRNIGVRKVASVRIHALLGPGPLPEDMPFVSGLYLSSLQRSWLECFQARKTTKGFSKTLTKQELEDRLDQWLSLYGKQEFRQRVDQVHRLADELGWQKEARRFQKLAGALLGTRPGDDLRSAGAKARNKGMAFDQNRDHLWTELTRELRTLGPGIKRDRELSRDEWANLCFFESYFSNYIEGTIFTVDEAADIVFTGKIPSDRPEGHDILGTYQVLFSMATAPTAIRPLSDYDSFAMELKRIHANIMMAHPGKQPGKFKTLANRVGATFFVKPDLVKGTLARGLEFLGGLSNPLSRALFTKFLISEVHPFADGNGRLSRIMMNRELHAGRQWPIIIPTVYRIDYRAGLRKLSLNKKADAYRKVMTKAQKIAPVLDYSTTANTEAELSSYRAFDDDESITLHWRKLEQKLKSL